MTEPLLDSAFLARLERLQLHSPRPLIGRFGAEHRSKARGSSIDFADYREYHPGDDYRRIDYNLYARLDVLVLKLFEAEEDATVRLLVDSSASMSGAKLRTAAQVAAALGFVALVRRDGVWVHTLGERRNPARFNGRGAMPALLKMLGDLKPGGTTDFAAAASDLLARPGPAGITVVISDMLTPEWNEGLNRLPARGAHVVVVHVMHPDELRPELIGDLALIDAETGAEVEVSLSPEVLDAYAETTEAWRQEVAQRARRVGATYVPVLAGEDVEALLLGAWREAGVLR